MALKLSASDKQTIVELYQHPEESTATLASRYGVSSSTISRILKQELSPGEYQKIVQQKKGGGSKPQTAKLSSASEDVAPPQLTIGVEVDVNEVKVDKDRKSVSRNAKIGSNPVDTRTDADTVKIDIPQPSVPPDEASAFKKTTRTRKRRRIEPDHSASGAVISPKHPQEEQPVSTQSEVCQSEVQLSLSNTPASPILKTSPKTGDGDGKVSAPETWVDEIQADLLESESFVLDDDELDSDDMLDDGDDDLDLEVELLSDSGSDDADADDFVLPFPGDTLSVLPFSEAKLPQTCYVIVDRSAELITRPLRTFADLGNVPEAEVDEETLPIFDNHRVAKRFANRRTQRIVKVPDAQVLRKTSSYLMDKGITRLLLDGQVYALMEDEEFVEEEPI